MLEIISQCSKIRGPSSGIQATGTKYRRFQPFLAVYRMHVTSMLLAHRSKCIPYVRARSSNSCAHAMSMLLDIHSKCMSCAPRRLRGCFWKREVKGIQLYTVTSMCFLDPCFISLWVLPFTSSTSTGTGSTTRATGSSTSEY